ncbi:hypothetical protein AMD27_13165 [Acinetobacter sp. TGL-Y2]|uniref:phage tail-collar fiber domain-containing protein n=1 Tax=Acinetobacter sp. TGL-Y2 TaxID=1407071 RepID=UPI0007A66B9B|nr:phage tail protein [Acinetobacter sp. TGL-Y2]AMW79752.1 hypothetical protein AMD27_13165 [Acinetobacter sp. TGL-Y2]
MAAKYYVTLTDYGSSLIAQAHNVVSIQLTAMVIGDANNQPYEPIDQKNRTTLVNERARVPIQSVQIEGQIARVSATLEAHIGGFNMHEYGFIDTTGQLVYIANFHGAYKPIISEGAGGELEIVTDIKADAGAQVLIQIDSNVVTANKQWVLDQLNSIKELMLSRHDIAVGDPFITTLLFNNSDEVAEHKGYGSWQKYGDGHALVSRALDSNEEAPTFMKIMGSTGGKFKHQLTIEELPKHRLPIDATTSDSGGSARPSFNFTTDAPANLKTEEIGADQAHNIVQKSIVIDVWIRTT